MLTRGAFFAANYSEPHPETGEKVFGGGWDKKAIFTNILIFFSEVVDGVWGLGTAILL